MKKLRIKDRKLFKQAMKVLAIMIISIILVVGFANYLKINGLDSLFTTNLYREAFGRNPNDIVLINRLEVVLIVGIVFMTISELKSNKEIRDLEKEEELICG